MPVSNSKLRNAGVPRDTRKTLSGPEGHPGPTRRGTGFPPRQCTAALPPTPQITGPRDHSSAPQDRRTQLSTTLTWSPAHGHGLSLPVLGTKMFTKRPLLLIQSTDVSHLSFSLLSNRLLSSQQLQASRNPKQKVWSCHGPCQPPHCPSCGHPALVTGLGPNATLLPTTTATLPLTTSATLLL